jgi:hypothetical protein
MKWFVFRPVVYDRIQMGVNIIIDGLCQGSRA